MPKSKKDEYLGTIIMNNQGHVMKIIDYINNTNITVIFEDNTVVYNRSLSEFRSGRIKNPNIKTFKQKCIDANINYDTAQSFRKRPSRANRGTSNSILSNTKEKII